ncbi:uncharacterized protein JCM6883_000274 [Sporobolomyces salmoneus]|uniref:uncharacterized protein n=1 Tax=Sporobolomyces salmoneus TaxID=183962 RepID=UPI003175C7DA
MGKAGQARKRRRAEIARVEPTVSGDLDNSDGTEPSSTDFMKGLISPGELATAARVLETLSKHPEALIKDQRQHLKQLKTAVWDFQRQAATVSGTGSSLTSRISEALSSGRHTDALVLLSELRIRKLPLPLGSLNRWVRECDAASRSDGSFGDAQVLRVLDSILRCTYDVDELLQPPVVKKDEWVHRELSGLNVWKEIQEGSLPKPEEKEVLTQRFRLLHTTPGPQRLPPNQYPALLFHSHHDAIPLSSIPSIVSASVPVPGVDGAMMLTDVLSQTECREILSSAESVGFHPDQPIADRSASVLAHNLYWLADEGFLEKFVKRFLHLVPQEIHGGKVKGINPRFRVYRYVPGAIYRPHIDGAWPRSGIDPKTGEYLYDSSPPDAPEWSRLTLLIYLNDGFEGGCTTFFVPSGTVGTMDAFPVKPIAGCALAFPHGSSIGSLLHEGSPVGIGGAKYVIRTEILYESKEGFKAEGFETSTL